MQTIVQQPMQGSSNRNFGYTFAFVFLLVGILPYVKALLHSSQTGPIRWWSLGLAFVFLLTASFRPELLKVLNLYWTKLGFALAKIMNPIVMGVLFIGLVTPFAILSRILGRDVLCLKLDSSKKSYWVSREKTKLDPESMRFQF